MFTLGFLIIYYILIIYRNRDNSDRKKIGAVIACIVAVELAINSYLTFGNLDRVAKYPFVAEYNDVKNQLKDVTSTIMEEDDDKYRIEFVNKRSMNDGFGIGFPSISHFDSVYNYDVKKAVGNLGVATGHNWIQYSGTTPIVDTLLNIKYVATEEDKYMGYDYLYDKGFNTIFKNPYALSIGFMVADDLNKVPEAEDPLLFQSNILNGMLGESEAEYYKKLVPTKEDKLNIGTIENKAKDNQKEVQDGSADEEKDSITFYKEDSRQESKMIYNLKTTKAGSCFMHIKPTQEYMLQDRRMAIQIKVNGEEIIQEEKTPGAVYYLGEFDKGEDVIVELILIHNELQCEHIRFYEFEEKKFDNAIEQLDKGKLNIVEHGNTYIEGEIEVDQEKPYLYLSIPYDKGWKLFVDQKEHSTQKLYNGFLGAKLEKGKHSILLKYEPVGLIKGIIITVSTLFCILLSITIQMFKKYNKKQQKNRQKNISIIKKNKI